MEQITLLYDGTFEGLFTAIFECYDQKLAKPTICKLQHHTPSIFDQSRFIETDSNKAKRVFGGLVKKISASGLMKLKKAFHSEFEDVDTEIVNYVRYVFSNRINIESDYRQHFILRINQVVKMVNREIHRMHAFIRFQKTADNIYAATIRPDFDVVPFIGRHFHARYADQEWFIYDTKRNYGLHYDLEHLNFVELEDPQWIGKHQFNPSAMSEEEDSFQKMWKLYFDSTCIAERRNMKLHLRHVPHRYWRYLPEKTVV